MRRLCASSVGRAHERTADLHRPRVFASVILAIAFNIVDKEGWLGMALFTGG
jgi:hypothetical protein